MDGDNPEGALYAKLLPEGRSDDRAVAGEAVRTQQAEADDTYHDNAEASADHL